MEVPAGIDNGQRIRIGGAGHAGESGARAGDLYVQVVIGDDPRFHREGSDLVTVLEVPATSAMLGATLPVETLTGERDVELDTGAQHGDSIRLRGEGLPRDAPDPARGHESRQGSDPGQVSDDQRELVESLDATLEARNAPGSARQGLFERVRRAFR